MNKELNGPEMPKTAWVIAGGGARIVQAQALIEKHIKKGGTLPEIITGTSAGGLLAFLISHLGVDGARKEILNIRKRQDLFTGFMFFGPRNPGLWYSRPLQKIIERIQNKSKPNIPTWVCSYDTVLMQKVYLPIDKNSPEAIASTACIPFVVEPTLKRLVDGGIVENTPLKKAIDLGATEIEVFMCSAQEKPKEKYINGKLEMILRVFEAQRIEIALDDISVCRHKNEDPTYRQIAVNMHVPNSNLLEILDFDKMRKVYSVLNQ